MWLNPQFPADLVTFTEEIHNEKLYVFYELDQQLYSFNFGWRIFENCSLSSRSNYFKKNKRLAEPTFYLKISFSHVNHPHKNLEMLTKIIVRQTVSPHVQSFVYLETNLEHFLSVIISFEPSGPIIQRLFTWFLLGINWLVYLYIMRTVTWKRPDPLCIATQNG